jgi:hypothetical protein
VDKDSTFGITPGGLASLLSMGIRGKRRPVADPLIAELLNACWASALPAGAGRSGGEIAAVSGPALGEVLLDSATDLATIQKIKDYGKGLAACDDSEADHTVGVTIYYAAIASALVFHGNKITRHSYRRLADAFDTLQKKPWVPSELSEHLRGAHRYCIEKSQSA